VRRRTRRCHGQPSLHVRDNTLGRFAGLLLVASVVAVGCKAEGSRERVSVTVPVPESANRVVAAATARPNSCRMLVTELCTEFGDKSGVCRRMRTRALRFSDERCQTMLKHYDKVADEARRVEEGKQALLEAHSTEHAGNPPAFGPANAKVTLVEFSDFTCSECARGSLVTNQIRSRYPEMRFVFRQYPSALEPQAHRVAEASLAAQAQGKFWEFHDCLFSNQHDLSDAALTRYAKEVGLDLARFSKALDTHAYAARVDADLALGKKATVSKPPALFANGEWVDFPYDSDALDAMLDGAKAAAQ